MPRKYLDYLQRTAARPPFSSYAEEERMRDFTEVFGDNLPLFDARYLRFVTAL